MGGPKKRDTGTIDSGIGESETGNIDNQDGVGGHRIEDRGTGEAERGTGEAEGRTRTRTRIANRTGRNNSRGKTGRKTKTADSLSLNGETVAGLHHVLAALMKMPELAISLEEGNALAESINTVCKEYNLIVDSKTAALIGLVTTAGMIYVPRFGAAINRIKTERIKRVENLNRYEQREPVVNVDTNGTGMGEK